MVKMRTIKQAVEELKANDARSAISEWYIRQLVKSRKLPSHRAGNKYLINLDLLEDFLSNPPTENDNDTTAFYGKIRKVTP